MYSSIYCYRCIHTDTVYDTWLTKKLEQQIIKSELFTSEGHGEFRGIEAFYVIQLMYVSNWDNWNNNDYNVEKTNYIDIVSSVKNENNKIEIFLIQLAVILNGMLIDEN